MKMFITVAASLMFLNVAAAESLGDMKRMALDQIGRDMNSLESNKTCINGAKTVTEFNNCKYDMGHDMKMQKQETKKMDKPTQMMEDKAIKNKEMMDQAY